MRCVSWLGNSLCGGLGPEAQLGGLEAVLLGHRVLGAAEAVPDQLAEEGEADPALQVEPALAPAVHEDQVIALPAARDVHVLAKLDVPLRPEDDRAAVAPGGEAVRREPVHAHVVRGPVGPEERRLAEGLELALVGVREVAHGRARDRRGGRAGVEEELPELVAAYVAQDAAVLPPPKEPRGTGRLAQPVRP